MVGCGAMVEQPDALEVRVLGPMQIRGGGGPIALGGAKQRTLLALLVLSAGEIVPVERIVDELCCDIRDGPSGRGTEVRMVFAAPGVTGH